MRQEGPNLVVLVGDQLTSAPDSAEEQKQALNNVIRPMEDAGAPRALTFGNHDEDVTEGTGFGEPEMLEQELDRKLLSLTHIHIRLFPAPTCLDARLPRRSALPHAGAGGGGRVACERASRRSVGA